MTIVCQALDHVVVTVLVRDKECAFQRTIVGIQAILSEYLLIMIEVIVIYCTIECYDNHLRRLKLFEPLYLCV